MDKRVGIALLLLAIVILIGATLLPARLSADPAPPSPNWHQEAQGPQHTGYTPEDLPKPWSFKWQWNGSCDDPLGSDCRPGDPEDGYSFQIPPKSHIVEGDGRLYLPSGSNGIWAINQLDGTTAWHNQTINSTVTAAFDPDTDALFVAASDGLLYKLNPSNGTVMASFQADSGLNLAPIIAAGKVYVVSDNGTLYAIDKSNMTSDWSYSSGSPGQTPAAYSEGHQALVFATEDLFVHAVNDADGSLRWRVKPTVNVNDGTTYDGGDGRMYLTYNYEHGWPVIAEDHGLVFIRLHLPAGAIWSVPEPENWFPTSNDEIRSFLMDSPHLQSLFALNLGDGSSAFIPAVGYGYIDTPGVGANGGTLPPPPVVRRVDDQEVVYVIWRNGLKCQAGDCTDPRWDAVMGEMVLDDSTVPDYQAGDLRFVQFHSDQDFLITDEMGMLSMAGNTLFHSHWVGSYSYRIADRSDSLGATYLNPITTEKGNHIDNRGSNQPDWVTYEPDASHFTGSSFSTYEDDGRLFRDAFWIFFNTDDPAYVDGPCENGYYTARYTIVHDGTIYYETNAGTIFAVDSAGATAPPPPHRLYLPLSIVS